MSSLVLCRRIVAGRLLMSYGSTRTCAARRLRAFLFPLALAFAIVSFAVVLRAAEPKNVAGADYFTASVTGQPLTWTQGTITYFTDQGALSPIFPNSAANTLVASAFNVWTAVPTAAVTATSGGELAEDVNGTNVYLNADGTITMPADIQPAATGTPVGVVYDYDGSVTNALLGAGAGATTQCFSNAVYGGDDNFSSSANYVHALIVINGQCALASSQQTDVEYRLVRVIGAVLGVGWSQLNLNVITGSPHATSADYAGFPVMHSSDPTNCVPITLCYPNPYQLANDDAAALSRLYPVTSQNLSSFPGKQVFATATAGIHGSVWFTNNAGTATVPMQGVNVVARWIDPSTGTPSRQYAVSSVSGFLFTGNSGNAITGFDDDLGNPLVEWGSNQTTTEGYFDLSGLPLPDGASAQYQLSVEAVDPNWSSGVGPYANNQVEPSGIFTPILINVSAGQDVEQDILMSASAQPIPPWDSAETWTDPASVPSAGDWAGSLNPYGNTEYFQISAQANRTLSVAVTALNESGMASNSKARPVIGIWSSSDPQGTAPGALTTSPFNSTAFGVSLLSAQINTAGSYRIGIADLRGDGRPDYHYHASVLYADSVSPARIGVGGGPVAVLGTGFVPGLGVSVGSTTATQLQVNAGQIILNAPPASDGAQNITVTNPATGASSTMAGALTYGAASTDILLLLSKTNPPTPLGTQAANPVSVQVVASDGVTPVAGATIGWSATNGVQLSACAGASACSVTTDQSGMASTWLVPTATGAASITATLAPGVYTPAQSVSTTLNATETSSDIGVLTPYLWIAQGATVTAPVTARVLSNGVPQSNAAVNFFLTGSGSLSASSATTNASGYASVTLSVTQFAALAEINACVAPGNAPCQTIYADPVAPSQLQLWPISGEGQIVAASALQPVVMRVTDSSSPPNAVLGATVAFLTTVLRPGGDPSGPGTGETNPGNPATPVILSVSQSAATSDANGLVSSTPSGGSFSPPLEVDLAATAGTSAALNVPLWILPGTAGPGSAANSEPASRPLPGQNGAREAGKPARSDP